MSQWRYILDKFHAKGGILTTYDFISDIHTAAEYRRSLCDLKCKGFRIESIKGTPRQWVYKLIESQPELIGG